MASKEEDIETSLKQYRCQLDQIEEALKHNTSDDLLQLKTDLQELINLTEGSLLSLKKSNLLSLVGTLENSSQHSNEEDTKIETSSSKEESEHNEIIGMKCRAPFCHDWGEMSYHNAIIFDIESSKEGAEMVRVVFCNPTHTSMLFCKHFAEGFCRFEDSNCRFSHGHLINISEMKPFEEPFFENILVGEKCLAKDSGELWHKATIVDILEDKVQVMFDSDSHVAIKELQDIHPSGGDGDDNDDDSTSDEDDITRIETEEKNATGITDFSLKTTDVLGQWEKHTKGIGSKLMLKMGYVIGEGLGKNSDGRAVPVPIEVLPQGKSLDKVMELRNKKKHAFKPSFKQKAKGASNASTPKGPTVFDLINHKFSATKNKTKHCLKSKSLHHISTEDLSKKSDKHINIQLLKTAEELKRSDHELRKLKDTLARSIQRGDQVTAKKINEKIKNMHEYQNQLRTSEQFMKSQKNSRKAHKDLISF